MHFYKCLFEREKRHSREYIGTPKFVKLGSTSTKLFAIPRFSFLLRVTFGAFALLVLGISTLRLDLSQEGLLRADGKEINSIRKHVLGLDNSIVLGSRKGFRWKGNPCSKASDRSSSRRDFFRIQPLEPSNLVLKRSTQNRKKQMLFMASPPTSNNRGFDCCLL